MGGFFVGKIMGRYIELSQGAVSEFQLGDWSLSTSSHRETLDPSVVDQERALLKEWADVDAGRTESTWANNEHQVPTLIVRFDGTIDPQGQRQVWEIEHRPGWIGLSQELNTDFATRFTELRANWPDIVAVTSDTSKTIDDQLWTPTGRKDTKASHVLLRAEPHEDDLDQLVGRSIAPVLTKGDKGYGEAMGLWTPVDTQKKLATTLEAGVPVVLKPRVGSKLTDVKVWLPPGETELFSDKVVTARSMKNKGAATRGKIETTFGNHPDGMYAQPFHSPMVSEIEGQEVFVGHRSYWGYNIEDGSYEPLGGLWMARPNLLLHGTRDAIVGPLTVAK